MSLEQKINYQLNKFPAVKKVIKRAYQTGMYAISPKIKSEGNITRISPNDNNHEYFFGYYDKSPWDITDRYVLCMRAKNTWADVSPREKADILLIDTDKPENDSGRVKKIAETHAWNVQQSCMLQWLGPDFSSKVLYNDFRDGKYVSVILTLATMEEKVIPAAVYSVSADGKFALTLDFSRLYELRPGYGYYNVPEKTKGVALPDTTAIWKIDLETGEVIDVLKYTDFAKFQPRSEMQEIGSVHKVNHIMISPNGKRFMVLYRWFNGQRKYTRLVTCNVDGTDMYVLSDDDMVSHCFWKDDETILAFENKKKTGPGYYLMRDKTQEYIHCWPQFSNDGHPSYSPNKKIIVTDSYPDRARVASINIMSGDETKKRNKTIARVFAPFKYDNDTRCDLHPRWNHRGDKICFDSVFEGHRGLYYVSIKKSPPCKTRKKVQSEIISNNPKYSIITPMFNSYDLMDRYFESLENQTFDNFEVIIVDDFSTDGSYENACKYAKNTSFKIKVFRTKENSGPGVARNIGMKNASGEWITFVDNDDWIENTTLEEIDNIIKHTQTNCVIYDYYTTNGVDKAVSNAMYFGEEGAVSISDCIKYVRNHTGGKFYKAECLKKAGILFPRVRRCEDVAFVVRAIESCKSAYYHKKPLLYYYQRTTSLSNNKKLDESDMIKAFKILDNELGKNYSKELEEKSVTDLLYGVVLMMAKSKQSNSKIREYICNYEKKYPNWWNCEIVNYVGRAKKIYLLLIKSKNIIGIKILSYVHSVIVSR